MKWTSTHEGNLPFTDREEAGKQLASKLKSHIKPGTIVLAIPRGGVVTGRVIAKELGLAMDLMVCKKVGHPGNPEYAIGSVCADGSSMLTDKHADGYRKYFDQESINLRDWLSNRYTQLTDRKDPLPLKNKEVLICDDGVATGSTMMVAVQSARKSGASKIFVATPVISTSALSQLNMMCDVLFFLYSPDPFGAVGEFYISFPTVTDDEVKIMMHNVH